MFISCIIKRIPILFVAVLISLNVFVYLSFLSQMWIGFVFFCVFLVFFLVSFLRAACTSNAQQDYPIPPAFVTEIFCNKCGIGKAPNAHHCSMCEKCILAMDHHCVWIGNCVGFYNFKFFFLLCFYACLVCLTSALVYTPIAIENGTAGLRGINGLILLLALFYSWTLAFSLLAFMMFHLSNVSAGASTISTLYPDRGFAQEQRNFDLYNVFTKILGKNPLLWFIPIFNIEGNGYE